MSNTPRRPAAYHFEHFNFSISVVSDGIIVLPAEIVVPDAPEKERGRWLARLGGGWSSAPMNTNIPVIKSGADIIIVDTGSGDQFQQSAGGLLENLKDIDLDPNDVSKVVFTHMHPDHAGGTIRPDGGLAFPNADYFASAAEHAFWCDPGFENQMPAVLHDFAKGAQRSFEAVAERLHLIQEGDSVAPGITARSTPGHTPGHMSLHLEGGDGLLIVGDAITNPIVPFENPGWGFGFDVDRDLGIDTRRMLLSELSTSGMQVLGYHWLDRGLGRVERAGSAYRFVPA